MIFTLLFRRQTNTILLTALFLLGGYDAVQAAPHPAVAHAPSHNSPAYFTKHMRYYQLTVNYKDLKPDVQVNDMPIQVDTNKSGFVVDVVNQMLTGASSTLSITTQPAQGEAQVPVGASLQVDLTSFANDEGADPQTLFHLEWKKKEPKEALPHINHVFQATPPAEPLSWQNGTVLQKASLDKAGINAQIQRLYTALETKNIPATLALLSSEAHDDDIGTGVPHHDPDEEQRSYYEESFRNPAWKVLPIHFEALEYDLYGGGRVVWVHTQGHGEVFQSAPDKDGSSTAFDPYLSLINGHWVIVR